MAVGLVAQAVIVKWVSLQETCWISKPAKEKGSVGKKKHLTWDGSDLERVLFLFYESGLEHQHAKCARANLLYSLPPYHPDGLEHIPESFWLQPAGTLIAKALARAYQHDLIGIKEAAQIAHVSSPTVSIAVDKGDLTAYIVPTLSQHRGKRLVRRSQVLARWKEREPAPSLPPGAWDVYEQRFPEGRLIIVICNRMIVNQWVTRSGTGARYREYPFAFLGEEEHDPGSGHPEWVGQPVSILKGRYFRRVHSQEELQQYLQIHRALNERTPVLP